MSRFRCSAASGRLPVSVTPNSWSTNCACRCRRCSWIACAAWITPSRPAKKAWLSRAKWSPESVRWCKACNSAPRSGATRWRSTLPRPSKPAKIGTDNSSKMATDLVEIDPQDPQPEALERAAAAVRRGKVVAIPTDALYLLVADPFNLRAVTGVFHAKGRESNRALPILIRDTMMAEELASELTARFFILARRFWPGPLTIIVPAAAKIPLKVTGNTGRLALRHSRSEVATRMIALLDQPLISTSANISGHPTCHSGIDVFGMMDGRVDLVLDGGRCTGQGATTIDITEPYWRVIKSGAIAEKEIAECLESS